MSLSYMRVVSLKCDVCGNSKSFGRTNDMTARVLAQRQGWKYAIYLAPETEIENGARRFVFDACPSCQLPERLAPLPMNGERDEHPAPNRV